MTFHYDYNESDLAQIRSVLAENANNKLVMARARRNLAHSKQPTTKSSFWEKLVSCLLTSVQRSGPRSPVSKFLSVTPFPLRLEICEDHCDLSVLAQGHLQGFGGIRFGKKIAKQICKNIEYLKGSSWEECKAVLEHLRIEQTLEAERKAARFIDKRFAGIGPKQARNLLQMLGLTRYEIPIDSRVVKWFKRFGFPIPLASAALADADFYEFVEDLIQNLCRRCDVFPCMLDASIFANADSDEWTDEMSELRA